MKDVGELSMLGRYRLLRRIGRGGMGEVWLAEDPQLLRQVALKILPLRRRDDQEFSRRFAREARAAAALHHPHILPVHDFGQQQTADEQTVTYLVMSYVSGGSVDERLKAYAAAQRLLARDEALSYLFQAAEAIDYAHSHDIIHRDIKPGNFLLREDNWLLLTDFGIARMLIDGDTSTTGSFLGTPSYMAPEQAQGQAVPASDIYSLAVVAYQLFTGRVPFQADNPFALTFQHAFTPPTSPLVYNPALPPAFAAALLRGLEKNPVQRPRSAVAYVTGLDQALRAYPAPLSSPVPSTPSSLVVSPLPSQTPVSPIAGSRPTRRKMLLGLGAGAGVLLLGGGITTYVLRTRAAQGPMPGTPTPGASPSTTRGPAGGPLALVAAFTHPVSTMAWSPVKNILATATQDGQLALWNMPAAVPAALPQQAGQQNTYVTLEHLLFNWSPDGQLLAVGNGGFDSSKSTYETLIYTSNLSGLAPAFSDQTLIESPNAVQGVTWIADHYLATITNPHDDYTHTLLTIWNMQQPRQKSLTATLGYAPVDVIGGNVNFCAAVSPGSTLALSVSGGVLIGKVNTSSTGTGIAWQRIAGPLSLPGGDPGEVAWSSGGQYVAAVLYQPGSNGVVGIWDATRQYQPVLPGLSASSVPAQLTHLAWSPRARTSLLALSGSDGKVYLWDVTKGPLPVRVLSGNVQGNITALAWSADGHWLAVSYDDSAATILFFSVF